MDLPKPDSEEYQKIKEYAYQSLPFVPGEKDVEPRILGIDGYNVGVIDASQLVAFNEGANYLCFARNISFCTAIRAQLKDGRTVIAHVLTGFPGKDKSLEERIFLLRLKNLLKKAKNIEYYIPKFDRTDDQIHDIFSKTKTMLECSQIEEKGFAIVPDKGWDYKFGYSVDLVFTKDDMDIDHNHSFQLETID